MLKILSFLNELDVTFGTMLHVIVSKFLSDCKIITYTFERCFPFKSASSFWYHVKYNCFKTTSFNLQI